MTLAAIRTATPADAAAVARAQLAVWQHAYAELLPTSVLFGDPEVLTPRWAERIAAGGPVLLAMEGGEMVGFVALSAGPYVGADGPAPQPSGAMGDLQNDQQAEIEQLLVVPRWARRGHGGRLLASGAQLLQQRGFQRAHWWAPDSDRAVERFLAGVSWFPDGGRRGVDTGEQLFTEIRYAGALDLRLR